MVDRTPSARDRLVRRRAACLGLLLLAALVLALLVAAPSAAGGRFDPVQSPTPETRIYLPAIWGGGAPTPPPPPGPLGHRTHLPLILRSSYQCPSSSTAVWAEMSPRQSGITGAAQSPDLNMNVRGWYTVQQFLGFVRYPYPPDDPPDTLHPLHLSNIAGSTSAAFVSTVQANDWDWYGCNCATPRSNSPYPVTMLGLRTTPGQALRIASRNLAVDPAGYKAMVLYADARQIALKYTWEDRVDTGYLVHLVNLCVDPNLVALYDRLNAAGRKRLPAVTNQSVIGLAQGDEVDVIVRDSGSFMDPRSWQDWWQDLPPPP